MSELKLTLPKPPVKADAPKREIKSFSIGKPKVRGTRTAIYGTGGVGKTTLAMHAKGRKLVYDLDKSLSVLWPKFEEQGIDKDIQGVNGIETWNDMLDAMSCGLHKDFDVVCIDTMTKTQELASIWVPENVRGDKGQVYKTIVDFPWGDGFNHLYEQFLKLFAILEDICDDGKDVILICHECTTMVPNPEGAEFLQYEPNLSNPKSGRSSIRLKLKDWVDNLLFVQNGKVVDKDGKANGTNQRIAYPTDQAWAMAKSRVFDKPFVIEGFGEDIWDRIQSK